MADQPKPAAAATPADPDAPTTPGTIPAAAAGGVVRRGRPPGSKKESPVRNILHIRIDDQLQLALNDYMTMNSMTASQAIRVLITLGLDHERTNPEAVFHAAAFREGLMRGMAVVGKRINTAIHAALREIETGGAG